MTPHATTTHSLVRALRKSSTNMFSFKQFDVRDERSAMKVGTDGVLLGAWADVATDCRILDIGTGSGIISLMVAQRNADAQIVGLDIDAGAVADARDNARRSPWSGRIEVVQSDIALYETAEKFDHIVSNPPYFNSSLHSPSAERTTARHTSSLDFRMLVESACRLLREGGRLSVVLPTDEARRFRFVAFGRLHLRRLTDVATKEGSAPQRTLMEFELTSSTPMPRCSMLTIHTADGSYSEDYQRLTNDFYLKF